MSVRFRRLIVFLVTAAALFAAGCGFRPDIAAEKTSPAAGIDFVEAAPKAVGETVETPQYTVSYFVNGSLAASETVEEGAFPAAVPVPEGVRMMGWTDENGERTDPKAQPVGGDRAFYAVTGPLLNEEADYLFPDEHGFLLPQAPFTGADAAAALRALAPDEQDAAALAAEYKAAADAGLTLPQLQRLLEALFTPDAARAALESAFPTGAESVDRARAVWCVEALLDRIDPAERYFPDVSPDHWAYTQLTAAAAPGTLEQDALMSQTLDGFLWFDGYLYRLDEEGYFVEGQTADGLTYDENGRYTSGNAQLDDLVAQTLLPMLEQGKTRQDLLRAVYLHVKNDFQYLVRNYYDNGENGWEISEALTMFETGKGNCYNYAGMFWCLSRGLGYNAVCFSGTQGLQYTPHAWTELLIDGHYYICDPELEMNYWYVAAMTGDNSKYTNNYMIMRENAGNWVYQAVGRN